MIYLDNNATTCIDPTALAAMVDAWQNMPLNPSSQHFTGRRARRLLDDSVELTGKLLGATCGDVGGDRLIVTSGGTEANNLALEGFLVGRPGPLIVSSIEHPSVLETAVRLQQSGRQVIFLPVDQHGIVSVTELELMLADTETPCPALVSVMLANNESGAIQPLTEIVAACRSRQIPVHTDASQMIGKLPVSFGSLGVTAMTIAPHKFHGPVGIGGLLIASGWQLPAMLTGGGQQFGTRPGTEAVPLAIGMSVALQKSLTDLDLTAEHISDLRNQLEQGLTAAISCSTIHSHAATRLPNTTLISFPPVDRQAMLMRLDLQGIAASSGSACSSGSSRPSHVLSAMNVPPAELDSAIRFSLSRFSTEAEIISASERILKCYNHLRGC